jgi:hygromycin-B 4-O-kinase
MPRRRQAVRIGTIACVLPADIDEHVAAKFLAERLDGVEAVEFVGEGAWSRCFGFRCDARELVVRFGRHLDDFEKDRAAGAWRSANLPIPEVLDVGEALGGYFAISTRAYGVPLESLDTSGWRAVTPSLLSALDDLRAVPVLASPSFGDDDRRHFAAWRDYLLSVRDDWVPRRTQGWRQRLQESERGTAAFAAGLDRLDAISRDLYVRPTLVHNDLVNRNVLVDGSAVTAIFDWGCAFAGDFLYDIATIVFWTPWYAALDEFDLLAQALVHFERVGADLHDVDRRLEACALHIGLVHIAYNAFLGDWPTLDLTADRTESYIGASG